MDAKSLTARQQYWLNHLTAAAASDSTLVDYAKTHQLTPKHLYQWKTRLVDLGHLGSTGAVKKPAFVRVAAPRSSTHSNAKASLVMPNGIRLELQGALDRGLIRELIAAAGEL